MMDSILYSEIPPPSLQKLVEKHGGYDRIPEAIWKKYDAALKRWQDQISSGDHWLSPPSSP